MPAYVTPKLEFSTDPLSVSNAAATWKDITRYCINMDWGAGTSREFDDPQAGQATFVLKNSQRRFEPEYAAGAYYPNIVPGRRFRITLAADGTSTTQGIWYAQSWQVAYPAGTTYSTVTVTCTDGFWRLAIKTLPSLSPPQAESYTDVINDDGPVMYYTLNDPSGRKMHAEAGNDGQYKDAIQKPAANPVLGDSGSAVLFPANGGYARAPVSDTNLWPDADEVSCECVVTHIAAGADVHVLVAGPWRAADTDHIFYVDTVNYSVRASGGALALGTWASPITAAATYHVALTYDGSILKAYQNGVLDSSVSTSGGLRTPDANDYVYIGGGNHGETKAGDHIISHAAFYDYALSSAQVASHASAALSHGYSAQTTGTRIAALATDSLWSTAGITTGTITAAPRFQNGQAVLDEITETAKLEQPGSFFYFDDAGNPDYQALMDTQTVSATFGDTPAEVQYDDLSLVYNDELYNSSTVSGEGLAGSTAQNTTSISDYGTRAQDATGLIIQSNSDAALLAQTTVDRFSTPAFRVDTITLNGADQDARTQIITRQIGDTIRVKRRGEGGTAIDIITRILAKQKTLDVNGDLRCTWTLARGFPAATAIDHLGVTGYSELGSNFILS